MYTIEEIKKAILSSTFDEFDMLLKEYEINEFDKFGNTILHYFIKNQKAIALNTNDLLGLFYKNGININATPPKSHNKTPLYLAVAYKSKDIFDFLLNHGATLDIVDDFGNSPLWRAVMDYRNNDSFFIESLLSNGANKELNNTKGISPVGLANIIANYDSKKFF